MPGGAEIGQGGAQAYASWVVKGRRADAGAVGVVEVGIGRMTGGETGLVEGILAHGPFLEPVAPHRDRAIGAMKVVVEVGVRLHLAEVGEALLEAPLGEAGGSPGVVIVGSAPDQRGAVDGAGASGNLAAETCISGCCRVNLPRRFQSWSSGGLTGPAP